MAICKKCGSTKVNCKPEYFTTGGDLESVEWIHTCQECGRVDSETLQGCYGYDNEYFCPFDSCKSRYPS